MAGDKLAPQNPLNEQGGSADYWADVQRAIDKNAAEVAQLRLQGVAQHAGELALQ